MDSERSEFVTPGGNGGDGGNGFTQRNGGTETNGGRFDGAARGGYAWDAAAEE
jgi:hypothetical protein